MLRFIDDARDTLTDPENSMIVAEESGNPFAEGHAWVYRDYSDDQNLIDLENSARAGNKGLWSKKNPIPPWQWRRERRSQ